MGSGPLRGRSEPKQRALSALRGARRHGSSGVVLISGPSGIGKTALLSEICQQAATMKIRVATSKCDQIEQVWPGAPVIAMLRAGRDPLTTASEYEQITRMVNEPMVLVDKIASYLESVAMAGPLLIAIDDVQWADRTSRFLVRTLVSRLIGLPVVWLLASREDNLGLELIGHDPIRVEHIQLAPLSASELAAIAQDRLGRVPDERTRRFLEAADGNPFLATQIIDSLARSAVRGEPDTVPAEFTAAVAHRLAELTDAPRDLVQLMAVAGRPLPMRDVTALMPSMRDVGSERAVADAIESGLITAADGALTFRHDLVREAVYAAVPGNLARRLHQMFADYYLTVAEAPLVAASHARAAATPGDLASALTLISAAEALAEISADDAGELAALAFHTVRPAQAEWLELSLRCLSVLRRTQRPAEAIAVADLILARVDDGNLTAQVEVDAARALWLGGRINELLSRTERTLQFTTLDPAVNARLRAVHALANTRVATGDAAAREATAAVEHARAADDREALTLALQAAGEAARNEGRHPTSLRHFRELRSLFETSYLAEEITALQFLDRYDHAQTLLNQARADSRNVTETILPSVHCAQVWQDFYLGRLDDAEAGGRTLTELGQQLGNGVYTLDAIIVRIAVSLLRGDIEAAAAQLRRADDLTDIDDAVRRPGLTVVRGWLAGARGDLQSALDSLRAVLAGADKSCSYWPLWPCWVGLFFDLGTMAVDDDFAAAVVDVAEVAAARNPGVASSEGVALNLRGRSSDDLKLIAQSADILARSPRPILRGYGAESYGRALLAAGSRSTGLAQLDRAWNEYHQMDARVYRAEVERTMREAGARRAKWSAVASRPTTGWSSLTDAERRVARLIAAGHTNKSAASALDVSINTVGTHLRSVFAKLNIQSRVQLANALHEEMAR
ncbi:AAA family ATPase [Actinoallomurus purpureus]|uniref:helix-turn-helix transcriptional regulator n=1 Tax=Actinoallomurus purpureus TaxID=478114 RepID=UPI002093769D|nr:AAA family ATPase [Actinoallomurus purpureus]MCO6003461.1 AAA family ATPase [Actinoallomurus purpureus]